MCGIAGIAPLGGRPVEIGELVSMCEAMAQRGPDEEALYVNGSIGLGLRRLSIIGLEKGRQPVRNEDGMVVVVQNGEIYNYRELRRNLEAQGHVFSTNTDTEVIAHLYEELGVDCVTKLRGMFAFALWDERRQRLFLARDRLGIKPLYYADIGRRFAFASELKALLQLPYLERELNLRSLDHLFTGLTTPPGESIIANVHKLEPGHLLTVEKDRISPPQQYWRIHFQPDYRRSESETVEQLRSLLDDAVRSHMVSDVPVGAFLSGGVDSSTVTALMTRHASVPVHTFSIGFKERRFDESPYAREVAALLGTRHEELIVEPDLERFLEDFAWNMDEPFGDASAIPTFFVSQMAARELKVVLSGDGGDELFAGYDRYRVEARERMRERVPAIVRKSLGAIGAAMPEGMKGRNYLRHIALEGAERYVDAATLFRADARRRLYRPELAQQIAVAGTPLAVRKWPDSGDGHWLSRLQQLDIEGYLPLDILTKVDRMSMANSLEVRVPLLDYKLVEFAATIPAELLLRNGGGKYILKRVVRDMVPDAVLDRPKQGFSVPLGMWFQGGLAEVVRQLLLSSETRSSELLDTSYIEKLLAMHKRGRGLEMQLWTLISFELWYRRFLTATARSYMAAARKAPSSRTVAHAS